MQISEIDRVLIQVRAELPNLADHLREWAESHLCEPRSVALWTDPDRSGKCTVYLITDHTGVNDASCRIVYDPEAELFGLEQTLADGTEWYMGPQDGGFASAVESM